jgi:glycosyltransferase involved in cell wall biosynthesis
MQEVVGIASPSKAAYSETFIQAHKNLLSERVRYYYGGYLPLYLEGRENSLVQQMPFLRRALMWLARKSKRVDYRYSQARALAYSFKKEGVQAVLAEFGPTAAHILESCRLAGTPLIVHFHGYDAHVRHVIEEYRASYSEVFAYASKIVVVSAEMRQALIDLGASHHKLIVTACAPHDDFFAARPNYNTQNFLSIGRFVDKKAPYYTILAFSRISKEFPEARLYLVGDGPLMNACKNLARCTGAGDKIYFLGTLDRDRVFELLETSIAYVQHSITADNGDKEGTPVAVLEAGAAGIPVVSTKHAGIGDAVIDQKTGFLVEEHDVDGMAQKMASLLRDPELAEQLGHAAKQRIANKYRMEVHIRSLQSAIRAAITSATEQV